MTSIAPTIHQEIPTAPVDLLPISHGDAAPLPFHVLLASVLAEDPAGTLPSETTGEEIVGTASGLAAEEPEESDHSEVDGDAAANLSGLGLVPWQFLPPPMSRPLPPAGFASDFGRGESISPATAPPAAFSSVATAVPSPASAQSPAEIAAPEIPKAGVVSPSIASEVPPDPRLDAVAQRAEEVNSESTHIRREEGAAKKLVQPANPHETDIPQPLTSPVERFAAPVDGIPVAKQHGAMPGPIFRNSANIASAAFAEKETAPIGTAEAATEGVPVTGMADLSGGTESDGGHADARQDNPGSSPFLTIGGFDAPQKEEEGVITTPLAARDAAEVIQSIERAIERMRSHGGQQIEMRLPMRDGSEVVVKLRIEQGEVKATFQSASEELRQALETGWPQVAPNPSERAGRIASSVVEASLMEQGTGNFQQSTEQREQRRNDRYAEPVAFQMSSQPEAKRNSAPRPATGSAASPGLEIYA